MSNTNATTRTTVANNAANNATRTVINRTAENSVNSFSFVPAHYAVSETNSLLQRAWMPNNSNANIQTQNEMFFTEGTVFQESGHGIDCTFHHVGIVPNIRDNP
ncbi:12639_t:CDS:1 [Ambispora gerdemannii]|uniref:12639_t:CDS:1 n=1 Tax=Ambispora gerdemannii TaxID=144530 RepID=A0A9N8WII1_9GLOM|nr:12639_t:CDS:1 [Ambispora gerdemannii]